MGRINCLFDLRLEETGGGRVNPFLAARGVKVRLEQVSLVYGEGERVLDEVSLEIAPAERVALVGASGGDKSTLVQASLGLYPTERGCICYGGVEVGEIGWPTVRDHVGVVLQHPVLFNASVRENLEMGRRKSDAELWQALRIAQLSEVIAALPEGLDSVVGRQGVRLSGGQRQRLAIARMVLGDPAVVILDEATSALDAETERALHQALAEFLRGRTTLIIAHRFSAVRQADRILVFENGRIV